MGAGESKPGLATLFQQLESATPADDASWKVIWNSFSPEAVFETLSAETIRNIKEKNPAALVALLQQVGYLFDARSAAISTVCGRQTTRSLTRNLL